MKRLILGLVQILAVLGFALSAAAQERAIQTVLQDNREAVENASRRTVEAVIADLVDSGLPEAPLVLQRWRDRELFQRDSDGLFFFAREDGDDLVLLDISTGAEVETLGKREASQLRPNSGVRGVIGAALVQFQLRDPDIARRMESVTAIERDPEESHLAALRAALPTETDPGLKARMTRLERLLSIRFGATDDERIAAIESFAGDLGVDARAALNPVLATRRVAAQALPEGANIAAVLTPGTEALPQTEAYDLLVAADLAPPRISREDQRAALIAHISDGRIADFALAEMSDQDTRDAAYDALARAGLVPPTLLPAERTAATAAHVFFDRYGEPSGAVTAAAERVLDSINRQVALNQGLDLLLDGLSLASIYFLAAIGLAITFGVMRVINMAHGEFIMMGAYTGYFVQLFIPDRTLSIVVALPLAFAVTFAAGVAMERLVIRWLYSRPLETLLSTFGISIALQQIAKNIFGTQARPLTSPDWLGGSWVLNDVVSISYIRIAIFCLGLLFLGLLLYILNRTRLGLEVRAVTQNPKMAASMGINTDRINMLTFGLGSGIAGIAGIAIGLFAQVTSEIGQAYIVQSFMTVVVGGVGNIWGTLAGAALIGNLQKGIEWLNPSNTLAAQTYMIIFIIIFIQFRPRGIFALKGRAAEM